MSVFVNRDREMKIIDDSFQILQDRDRLLRNPILEFYGVSGIGKTLLLKQIKERCLATNLPYIWIDLAQKTETMHSAVIDQVKKYLQPDNLLAAQTTASSIKLLLQQGPVIMLFDAMDEARNEQVLEIELLLCNLIDDEKLFVVLASKTMVEFKNERSVARKLRWHTLNVLGRDSCEEYLNQIAQNLDAPEKQLDPEMRDIIFAWTQGYPLAMNVMVAAISDEYDPRTESGKQMILERLQALIIDREILKGTTGEWKEQCFSTLRLFSVPRRSNLIIMEELIKNFAPTLQRESSLAYFSLPKELYEATHIFSWNLERFGYVVEAPVRHLFVLLYSQTQPQEYFAVHDFLATLNYQLANEATGPDRVRYICEHLYHLASIPHMAQQGQRIMEAVDTMLKEPPIILQPFFEEFARDQELKEALGTHLTDVELAIEERASQIKREA